MQIILEFYLKGQKRLRLCVCKVGLQCDRIIKKDRRLAAISNVNTIAATTNTVSCF